MLAALGIAIVGLWQIAPEAFSSRSVIAEDPPSHEVDPFWPKPLPNNWRIGQVAGIAVDSDDNVWLVQRPGSLTEDEAAAAQDPPIATCCLPAPPIMQFDSDGNLLQAWGGPGEGYEWPENEHGLWIDHNDNIWTAGNGPDDHVVLKFAQDGTFLLQIGRLGETGGSNDTELLGRPADTHVDPETNEVYVADGYANKRVIVFDAETGEYKRHWGAYGKAPDDEDLGPYDPAAEPAPEFRNPVHCVKIANDGMVYVCDRPNNRIQVFEKDGTFVEEHIYEQETLGPGSVWDLRLSWDEPQRWLFQADGTNNEIRTLARDTLEVVSSFGRPGRNAGEFHWVHNLAVDSQGNIYTAEVDSGKRAQKFRPVNQGQQ